MIDKNKINEFVRYVCQDRDESHGYYHAKRVAQLSFELLEDKHLEDYVYVVAMLHDINDHKYYTEELNQKLLVFLQFNFQNDHDNLLKCIESISYSKELRLGLKYYEKFLNGDWLIIRNIVSDADKLESVGTTGLERCITFETMKYFELHNEKIEKKVLKNIVNNYCQQRLFKLENYMRTKKGYELYKIKKRELELALNKFLS